MENKKQRREKELKDLHFEDQKIVDVDMSKEVKRSFMEYSMSVIISRALPDARDGMKPGQRRVIYTMYEDRLTHDKDYRKSATTVGAVLGRYHPHGDSSVYGTMVRFAQDFSMRYPLIDGKGNWGSVDGDGAAAYRYTEARLQKISEELTRDIDKNVVDFMPNFDNMLKEPTVLPSRFPNLLVNGSIGIAVGMATNIPPHNLGEVIDATVYRMQNPDCSISELMNFVKGPDFPTGGIIYGQNGIKEAYMTGKGRVSVRSRAEIDEENRKIIISEIPYMVNKSMLCGAIANLVKEKRVDGITGLRDESGRHGMRIVIEYKKDANGQIILNQLYKYTQLQDTCSINMLAILDNKPKVMNLAQILDCYIAHQESVVTRRCRFELEKAIARAHILEGYIIATDNIDEVVNIMKTSKSIPESRQRLSDTFGLSAEQTQAIVDMTLGRLTGLEKQKIVDELEKLNEQIKYLREILSDINKLKGVIIDEMTEIKNKYSDERRTEIVDAEDDIILEDLIEKHNCVITMTHAGYIKRQPADTYASQRRGGKGLIGMTTKEEDFIEMVSVVHSHSTLLLFTNKGRVMTKRAFEIPEASRTAKGQNIVNIIDLEPGEKVTSLIGFDGRREGGYFTLITKNGIIKRCEAAEFKFYRKGGKIAITLDEGDELVFVKLTEGDEDLLVATKNGMTVRFSEENVRVMGRTARGVRGIRLDDGDCVAGVAVVEEGKELVTITEGGYGKRTSFDDFRLMKNRGGRGVICHNINEKTGKLASIATVSEDDDLMLITNEGTIIRTPVKDISLYSRTASGVKVMRLSEDGYIISFSKVANLTDEEIENSHGIDYSVESGVDEMRERDLQGKDEDEEDIENNEEVSENEENVDTLSEIQPLFYDEDEADNGEDVTEE